MMIYFFILLGIVLSQSTLQECRSEWLKIIEAAEGMLDPSPSSYSKMFMYTGFNLNNLGQYDPCLELDDSKYAIIQFNPSPPIVIGLCGPKVCSKSDYLNIFANLTFLDIDDDIFKKSFGDVILATSTRNIDVIFPKEFIDHNFKDYNAGAIIMLLIVSVIIVIAIIGTGIDYWLMNKTVKAKKESGKPPKVTLIMKYFLCFSVITNLKKLFTSRSQEKLGKRDTLEILNPVRVLSIGWVVFGHNGMILLTSTVLVNVNKIVDIMKSPDMIISIAGTLSVDSFFCISGVLIGYLLLLEINNGKRMNWPMLYIHRVLRVWPLMLFILFFFWALQKHMGNGPMWFNGDLYNSQCKDYWWSNLFFINNFIPDWKGSGCLGQGWYLADDMQFYIITPPIIFLYHKYHKWIGWAILMSLVGFTIIISGIVADHFSLNTVVFAAVNGTNYMDFYYTKPYCRIGAYAIGILSGFIIYSYRLYQEKGIVYDPISVWIGKKLENKSVRLIVGFIGLALINFVIFVQYDASKNPGGFALTYPNWSHDANVVFIAFHRMIWSFALMFVLLPGLLGHFSWMSWILSLDIWTPFSRLTFCVFLLQSNLMEIAYRCQRSALWLDSFLYIKDSTWFFFFCYLCAIPFVVLVEMPALQVEKLAFMSVRSKAPTDEKAIALLMVPIDKENKEAS